MVLIADFVYVLSGVAKLIILIFLKDISTQTLPNAKFVSLLSDSVMLADFDNNKTLVLVYFHPECEHCRYEAEEIGINAPEF